MNQSSDSARIMRAAIQTIRQKQNPEGHFTSLSSFYQNDFKQATPYATTFFTSVILSCLNDIPKTSLANQKDIDDIACVKYSAAHFLLQEKNSGWSWNYWMRSSKEYTTKPYPDDLDDTFMALGALAEYNRKLVDGEALASIIPLLTNLEIQEGGPYRTWLTGKDSAEKWKDVDLAVNSNIAYFLSLMGIKLPNIERLIDDAIKNNSPASPYYPSLIPVAYFISRSYRGSYQKDLAEMVASYLENLSDAATSLEQAMSISTLINLGFAESDLDRQISRLTSTILRGSYQPYAFCIDPARDNRPCYAGASSLTAAFCIEAIGKYSRLKSLYKGNQTEPARKIAPLHENILALAKSEQIAIPSELQKIAIEQIEKTTDEKITFTVYEFHALLKKSGSAIRAEAIQQLSLANLYGWMAYTIYDDFLDGEGDPLLLSAGNLFLRKLAHIYSGLEKDIPGVWKLFTETMDNIDDANVWEQKHCRGDEKTLTLPGNLPYFRNYENLANRSMGHALGVLAQLLATGYLPGSSEYINTSEFFRYYLIARQLHDDAHDWADDLAHGRITSAGAMILSEFQEQQGGLSEACSLSDIMPYLQELFWNRTISVMVQKILEHINMARATRKKSKLLDEANFMEEALKELEQQALNVTAKREQAITFLEHYRTRP